MTRRNRAVPSPGEFALEQGKGLRHVGQALGQGGGRGEHLDLGPGFQAISHRDSALLAKTVSLSEGFGHDQDVGEENGGIDGKPPQRLKRNLGGQSGRAHHFEKSVLGLELAIFRQVAPGLAHDPDRRAVNLPAGTGGEKSFAGSHGKAFIGRPSPGEHGPRPASRAGEGSLRPGEPRCFRASGFQS